MHFRLTPKCYNVIIKKKNLILTRGGLKMNNYYVYYEILSYNFCIITHDLILLNKQIEHISKFCITPPIFNKLENTINIEYIENKPLFNSLLNEFNTNTYEVLNTFEHERHYKLAINGSIYFLQPPNKYIVKKTNNYNFTVIGDGEKETIKYGAIAKW